MLTTIEELSEKIDLLNANTRELLYKLFLWNTEDADEIPVTIKVPQYPFLQTFRIPTKKGAAAYVSSQSTVKKNTSVKNWGSYSNNSNLRDTVSIVKGVDADIHILKYDGPDVDCKLIFKLSDASTSDSLEFIVTVKPKSSYSDNKLIKFVNSSGVEVCSVRNTPLSSVYDPEVSPQSKLSITYKITLRYVPDHRNVNSWRVFDFYAMPSFKFDGDSFEYSPSFVDPSA